MYKKCNATEILIWVEQRDRFSASDFKDPENSRYNQKITKVRNFSQNGDSDSSLLLPYVIFKTELGLTSSDIAMVSIECNDN